MAREIWRGNGDIEPRHPCSPWRGVASQPSCCTPAHSPPHLLPSSPDDLPQHIGSGERTVTVRASRWSLASNQPAYTTLLYHKHFLWNQTAKDTKQRNDEHRYSLIIWWYLLQSSLQYTHSISDDRADFICQLVMDRELSIPAVHMLVQHQR